MINSRCSPSISTQKVFRSCMKNVALSPHRDEHHRRCFVCSIPCDRSRAACSDAVRHPRNAMHEMCFQRSDPFFSQCHMETLHLLHHRCCAAHEAMPSTPAVQCFPGGETAPLTPRVENSSFAEPFSSFSVPLPHPMPSTSAIPSALPADPVVAHAHVPM